MMTTALSDSSWNRLGTAWLALTFSLAAHVVDEALTGFLDVYNPIVQSMRARLGWFPMPVFAFEVWIAGLCAVVVVLLALSPLAFRRSPLVRIAAYPYSALMLLNGVGHFDWLRLPAAMGAGCDHGATLDRGVAVVARDSTQAHDWQLNAVGGSAWSRADRKEMAMTAILEPAPQVKELPRAPELNPEELERRAYVKARNATTVWI